MQYERVYKVLQSRYLRADTYLDSPLLDMYLWNRNLYHKDFLMYRIGIGDVEFPMKIEFPEEVFGDEENILWREAKKIKEHYEILHQIPVLLDMGRYSQIGIITKDTIAGMELVRSIILQIALCNCYTEVKIGCIYNKNKVIQSQQWDFCRWLPHIWDANRQKRFIAGNEVEARRLFYDLLQIFKEREEVSISGKAEKILPHYILFVAEEQFLEGEMFSKYILDRGREYGLTVVWLDSMRKKLPNTCKMVLEINGGFTGRYEIERHSQKKEKIILDYTEKNMSRLRGELFSMVFQDPMTSLNPTITVGKQIGEAVRIHNKKMSRGQIRKRVIELMQLVEIDRPEERIRQYPHEFSGGMRQRAVMAIALAGNPKILFADEPTTALDVTIQAQILDVFRRIQKKLEMATMFISHDLGVVAGVADRVAVMYAGKIVEIGTAEEIYYDPRHPYTWGLLQSLPVLSEGKEWLPTLPGMPPTLIHPPKGDAFAERNVYAMRIDYEKEPPMYRVTVTHYAATWLLDERAPKVKVPMGGRRYGK